MTHQESPVSDAKIWSITLELLIMTLEASFKLIYGVYSTAVIYNDRQMTIIICL